MPITPYRKACAFVREIFVCGNSKGLALARSGDIELANQLLTDLAAEGTSDAETLGMLARTHKDLALRTTNAARRTEHLASAFRIYYQAYEVARRGAVASAAWLHRHQRRHHRGAAGRP